MSRIVQRAVTAALAIAVAAGATAAFAQTKYTAEVRRTSFGIAHIKANDYGSVGYGVGYAFAQDNFCTMADEFLTVRGERAKYLGGTGSTPYGVNNVFSDLFFTYFNGDAAVLAAGLAKMKPEVQAAFKGWAAGFNRYLRDTGVANLPAPCKGAPFISPVDEIDMMRLVRRYALQASSGNFIAAMMNTFPPAAGAAAKDWDGTYDEQYWREYQKRREQLGSNALALGSDATDNGQRHAPGQPALPVGRDAALLPVPRDRARADGRHGRLALGLPVHQHRLQQGRRLEPHGGQGEPLHALPAEARPSNPRKYIVDGQSKDMTSKTVTVQVRQADGSLAPVSRTIYSTQCGPAAEPFGAARLGHRQCLRDQGREPRELAHGRPVVRHEPGDERARDREGPRDEPRHPVGEHHRGRPGGSAFYADISTAPNVDRFHQSTCTPDVTMAGVFAQLGVPVLDGSRSACDWVKDAAAPRSPGCCPARACRACTAATSCRTRTTTTG